MVDRTTHSPVTVTTEGTIFPLLEVDEGQLDAVKKVLQAHNIPFWVEEDMLSVDGEPFVAFVHLDRLADVEGVQGLLDAM